jgi:hypothetical protein
MKSGSPPESAAGISPDSGEPPDARNHQMPTENTIYKKQKNNYYFVKKIGRKLAGMK